jgi:hypothetical protein
MNKIFENFRAFTMQTNGSEKWVVQFEKAIASADTYDDYGWTLNDFDLKHIGQTSLERLEQMAPFGDWALNEPKSFVHLTPEERVDSMLELDSTDKKNAVRKYIAHPEIRPPVVLVTAPDSDNDSSYVRIGYGTGLINLHITLGLEEIGVYHLFYKHEVLSSTSQSKRGLAGPVARLNTQN